VNVVDCGPQRALADEAAEIFTGSSSSRAQPKHPVHSGTPSGSNGLTVHETQRHYETGAHLARAPAARAQVYFPGERRQHSRAAAVALSSSATPNQNDAPAEPQPGRGSDTASSGAAPRLLVSVRRRSQGGRRRAANQIPDWNPRTSPRASSTRTRDQAPASPLIITSSTSMR